MCPQNITDENCPLDKKLCIKYKKKLILKVYNFIAFFQQDIKYKYLPN